MVSKSTLATIIALSASAAAQSSLITLPFYGYDSQSIVASVIAADSTATTLSLACPTDEDQNDCGLAIDQTLIYGPSTYNMYLSDGDFTMTQDCSPAGTSSAMCMESAGGASANFPGSSTTSYEGTDIAVFPVMITAGEEKLSAGAAGSATTGPASTSAMATGTGTSVPSGSVIVVSGTVSSTITSAAKTSGKSSSTGSGTAASTTTNAAVANAVAGPVMVAAGAGLMGLFL